MLDREVYLHADGEKDPERCPEAGIPEERRTRITKPVLAKPMLERAFAHGVKVAGQTRGSKFRSTKPKSFFP